MRRWPALAVLVAGALAAGCGATAAPSPPSSAAAAPARSGALRAVHAQHNRLLGGGVAAFRHRLATLRGHPMVVNVWGSWCGPCRAESGVFRRQGARLGGRVAFLGIDVEDDPAAARRFLDASPLPYPSYRDPDSTIARSLGPLEGTPDTAFLDRSGRVVYYHVGPYADDAALRADVARYLHVG